MILFFIMALSILAFVLSVIYFLYNYKNINNTLLKKSVGSNKITPVLANARGGLFKRKYTDLKSKIIKNKEKRVRFNEEVKILNIEINRQNIEREKQMSII